MSEQKKQESRRLHGMPDQPMDELEAPPCRMAAAAIPSSPTIDSSKELPSRPDETKTQDTSRTSKCLELAPGIPCREAFSTRASATTKGGAGSKLELAPGHPCRREDPSQESTRPREKKLQLAPGRPQEVSQRASGASSTSAPLRSTAPPPVQSDIETGFSAFAAQSMVSSEEMSTLSSEEPLFPGAFRVGGDPFDEGPRSVYSSLQPTVPPFEEESAPRMQEESSVMEAEVTPVVDSTDYKIHIAWKRQYTYVAAALVLLTLIGGLVAGLIVGLKSDGQSPTPAPTPVPTPLPTMGTTLPGSWEQLGSDIVGDAEGDQLGYAISLSADGSVLAIGAPGESYLQVWRLNDNSWMPMGTIITSENPTDFTGASVSLSDDGNVLAVGAPLHRSPNKVDAGQTRIYKFNGTNWSLEYEIIGSSEGAVSGYSVSLSANGKVLCVGSPENYGTIPIGYGYVQVYSLLNETTWGQMGNTIEGEFVDGQFGISVSLSADGTTFAVGSPTSDTDGLANNGLVEVYRWTDDNWLLAGSINGLTGSEEAGVSVSLSGNGTILAVGAKGNSEFGRNSGATRVYRLVGREWEKIGNSIYGEAEGDVSGEAVSLSVDGTVLAVGARGNDNGGQAPSVGHVRVFRLVEGNWTKIGPDINGIAAEEEFGWSVALSSVGTELAVGTPESGGQNGQESGAVRVYRLNE